MSNGTVSADQAARKAQIDAVNRDYVLQPRLGAESMPVVGHIPFVVHFLIFLGLSADYRTIGGVSGPLVIVDSVKVCSLVSFASLTYHCPNRIVTPCTLSRA